MDYSIREMTIKDLAPVLELWRSSEGLNTDDSDTEKNLSMYLERNPGLCLVAVYEGELIGAVECGQDERRGYLHHYKLKFIGNQ